jgi:hypothetical protein
MSNSYMPRWRAMCLRSLDVARGTRSPGRRKVSALLPALLLAVAALGVPSLASPAEARTSTGSWWWTAPQVTLEYGCTTYEYELVQDSRHCPATAPRFHQGIDLGLPCGTPIMAPVDGIVIESVGVVDKWAGQYAPTLRLPDGYHVLLAHVGPGTRAASSTPVPDGAVIAYVGDEAGPGGSSNGCHLHFEVRPPTNPVWGTAVDPTPWLNLGGSAPGGWWLGPTPGSGTAHSNSFNINVHAESNGNGGLGMVKITSFNDATNAWSTVRDQQFSSGPAAADVSSAFTIPAGATFVLISFDVYSWNGRFQLAPQGVRKICRAGTVTCDTSGYPSSGNGAGGGGTGGPTGSQAEADYNAGQPGVYCKNPNKTENWIHATADVGNFADYGMADDGLVCAVLGNYQATPFDSENWSGYQNATWGPNQRDFQARGTNVSSIRIQYLGSQAQMDYNAGLPGVYCKNPSKTQEWLRAVASIDSLAPYNMADDGLLCAVLGNFRATPFDDDNRTGYQNGPWNPDSPSFDARGTNVSSIRVEWLGDPSARPVVTPAPGASVGEQDYDYNQPGVYCRNPRNNQTWLHVVANVDSFAPYNMSDNGLICAVLGNFQATPFDDDNQQGYQNGPWNPNSPNFEARGTNVSSIRVQWLGDPANRPTVTPPPGASVGEQDYDYNQPGVYCRNPRNNQTWLHVVANVDSFAPYNMSDNGLVCAVLGNYRATPFDDDNQQGYQNGPWNPNSPNFEARGTNVSSIRVEHLRTDQTIDFPAIPDLPNDYPSFSLAATATSGLPVSYAVSGSCSLSGITLTLTGAGSCEVTASQGGDANWNPAADIVRSFTISSLVVTSPLTLTPSSPAAGQIVRARFTLTNQSSTSITLQRVVAGGRGPNCTPADWTCATSADGPTVTNVTIAAGASYAYDQTFTYNDPGVYFLAPTFEDATGVWRNDDLPGENRLNITVGAGLVIAAQPVLTPSVRNAGDLITLSFSVRNASATQTINVPRLAGIARGPNCATADWTCTSVVDFPGVNSITLAPGATYVYTQARSFSSPGTYFVDAGRMDPNGWWRPIYGETRVSFTVG